MTKGKAQEMYHDARMLYCSTQACVGQEIANQYLAASAYRQWVALDILAEATPRKGAEEMYTRAVNAIRSAIEEYASRVTPFISADWKDYSFSALIEIRKQQCTA